MCIRDRLGVLRHRSLASRIFDLGIYDNIMWNTMHGRVLGCDFVRGGNHVTAHVDPVLVLLTPLYALAPGAETLIALQAAAVLSGAAPVFLLALRLSSDAGGMSGVMSGGGKESSGSSAASKSGGDGRSGGESGAEAQTQSRLAGAMGAFGKGMQAASSIANKAVDMGSDVLGQSGIGSPGYSMTPTDQRSSRGSSNGGSVSGRHTRLVTPPGSPSRLCAVCRATKVLRWLAFLLPRSKMPRTVSALAAPLAVVTRNLSPMSTPRSLAISVPMRMSVAFNCAFPRTIF